MKINPYLVARLYAIQAAFSEARVVNSGALNNYSQTNNSATAAVVAKAKHWRDVLKEEDGEGGKDGEGGGGTMKGLRGKDAEYAKQAMRKLSRNR